MTGKQDSRSTVQAVSAIVAAFVSKNVVAQSDLAGLISQVHAALSAIDVPPAPKPVAEVQRPAVPVKKSISADHLVCLEDGLKFKSLKRHLRTKFGMTPEQYRTKWNLPADYPMVAPSYAEERSLLAKSMGFGSRKAAGPKKS